MLLLGPLSLRLQSSGPWSPGRETCSPLHGPSTMALGPLLKGLETRRPDGFPVARLVLLEQPVDHQKPKAARAHFDRRDQDHTP